MKIALNAGHGYHTPGKRCLKSLDPNETGEYILNRRVCDKIEKMLQGCAGTEVLRIDDGTELSVSARAQKANRWGADYYIAVHHNAGLGGQSGGGIEVYTYLTVNQATLDLQREIYESLIAHTGRRGNRSNPLRKADFGECRETAMPAVLIENGFMDSPDDTPAILTEEYATQSAAAIAEVIRSLAGAEPAQKQSAPQSAPAPSPTPAPSKPDVIYQVWDDVKNKWLPNVTNDRDYAGIFGHDVCAVFAHLSRGNVCYRVHTKGGGWLPAVKNREDYAGLFNRPVDGLMMRTDTGVTIYYRVHLRRQNRWLPWVTGYAEGDHNNGYAGLLGQEIDGIQIKF